MVLGVLTSLLAFMLDEVSDLMLQARIQLATIIFQTSGWWMSYLFYCGWAFAMAPMACIMALTLHEQAAGSGIPQLKSLMAMCEPSSCSPANLVKIVEAADRANLRDELCKVLEMMTDMLANDPIDMKWRSEQKSSKWPRKRSK